MKGSRRGLAIEIGFVLTTVIVLKEWVFPYFIWRFFPTGDMAARMGEWMMIIVGVITCIIYLGLGSTSRQLYRLSVIEAIQVFALIHLPLLIVGWLNLPTTQLFTLIQGGGEAWSRLIGDGIRLFEPSLSLNLMLLSEWIALILFLCGRNLRVLEDTLGEVDLEGRYKTLKKKR
ncbi:hypothetical protein SAMN05444487_104218 [Marininema mesophilum]|uniref:Uncharacterized protein n=1 Tax=Marininema mesophilum TaxID=1048340 RepID=A0A1H2UV06_9BACL|nr:hypothetical protein [Marininema mesophilum]SDW59424.1 hypothetical protein SAMN05444487_104218 [Marininema mesophilum]